jgi:hypothetical protein
VTLAVATAFDRIKAGKSICSFDDFNNCWNVVLLVAGMDDRRLEKIKKTFGLAHSDELNERASAIRQACAFMRRDNITLEDLLHYLGKDN